MTDPRLTTLAEILVRKCVSTKPMDKVWIRLTDPAGLPLAKEVYKQAVLAGALPNLDIMVEGLSSWFMKHANPEQLKSFPTLFDFQTKEADRIITIIADVNKANLAQTNKDALRIREKIAYPIRQLIMSKPWVLTEFPTPAMAQAANLNLEELEDFYFSATNQDWSVIEKEMRSLAKKLTNTQVQIVGEHTDLQFSTKGRIWVADDWKANMPGGEVFSAPVDDSVEGHVYFNYPLMRQGKLLRDIHLWFKKGKVVKATASENEDFLHHILDTDEGARRLGECAIGGNPGITQYMSNVLFDEKMRGTIHLALGQAYEDCGGVNVSTIHMDMIKDMRQKGSFVKANGKLILKAGKLFT